MGDAGGDAAAGAAWLFRSASALTLAARTLALLCRRLFSVLSPLILAATRCTPTEEWRRLPMTCLELSRAAWRSAAACCFSVTICLKVFITCGERARVCAWACGCAQRIGVWVSRVQRWARGKIDVRQERGCSLLGAALLRIAWRSVCGARCVYGGYGACGGRVVDAVGGCVARLEVEGEVGGEHHLNDARAHVAPDVGQQLGHDVRLPIGEDLEGAREVMHLCRERREAAREHG